MYCGLLFQSIISHCLFYRWWKRSVQTALVESSSADQEGHGEEETPVAETLVVLLYMKSYPTDLMIAYTVTTTLRKTNSAWSEKRLLVGPALGHKHPIPCLIGQDSNAWIDDRSRWKDGARINECHDISTRLIRPNFMKESC